MNIPAPRPGQHLASRPGAGPGPASLVPPVKKDFGAKVRTGRSQIGARVFLYGPGGVGKSTAGMDCPNPFFLCGEEGLVGPQFEEAKSLTPTSWVELLEMVDWLQDQPYEWINLDTVDWVEPLVNAFVIKRDSTTQRPLVSIEDYGYGKGYVVAAEEFRRLLARFDALTRAGKNVMVHAHSHIKTFNNPTGENYDKYEPKANKHIVGLLQEWSDATLFATFDGKAVKGKNGKAKGVGGEGRVLHTQQNAAWYAKNRYGLPVTMPFEFTEVLQYIAAPKAAADSAEVILAEIEAMIPFLSEEDAARCAATLAVPGKAQDAAFLTRLRNATSLRIQEPATQEEGN